jgi:uncharacterized protein (TIGR02757 family)
VRFPHRFSRREDREIAAFLAAAIAWGRRDLILRSAERLFSLLGPSPFAFVMAGNYRRLREGSIHRTFFEGDLRYFCRGFRRCYERYGSLEALFMTGLDSAGSAGEPEPIREALALFRDTMAAGNGGLYTKHIADPRSASACKRLNLSLRWLVRREGPVDLGLWRGISPALLHIPLDLHVGRVARSLGLLDPARKANDRKAVLLLTERLREFCPEDPARYDLALFSWGAGGGIS